ncbi:hypothetical protein [Mastigocoleus sp. MO_188.B34]|uniref:hypothetical protein n=1 Tax=Mastigocoleus sp. MO_188.B34 TaxID=3036635 RepID=UPI002605D96A|nr:hypothetical protein [Mastigocoleus sp. MO_188.B34]
MNNFFTTITALCLGIDNFLSQVDSNTAITNYQLPITKILFSLTDIFIAANG